MKCTEVIDRLKKIDKLINQGKTGTPDEFANRLHISRSQLYNYIDMLKSYGAPIYYNRKIDSFQYRSEFKILIEFSIQFISENETIKINAGNFLNFLDNPMKLDADQICLCADLYIFGQNIHANLF